MADSFNGSISIGINGTLTGDQDLGTDTHTLSKTYKTSFTNGTGANQANQMWSDTRTLSASAAENLDLAGVLVNALGTTLTFTSIKGIIISAASGNTNDVVVGGHASAAFGTPFSDDTDEILLKPGCIFALVNPNATGYAVTATTADLLEITNSSSGTSVTYDIILIGEV